MSDKIKVTNEEYTKILQAEADKYWKKVFSIPKEEYGVRNENLDKLKTKYWNEMDVALEEYEIIGFNINSKNEKIINLIEKLCNEEEIRSETHTLYRGSVHNIDIYSCDDEALIILLNDIQGFKSIEGGNGYSHAWQNEKELCQVSYCEGDVTISIHTTIESYQEELNSYIKFFKEEF